MAGPMSPLEALGAQVAASLEQDGGARARAREQARLELTARAMVPGRQAPSALRWAAPAVGVVAVAAAAWLWVGQRPGALEFQVDGAPGVAETWLAAPSARPLVVSFSDGTRLDIERSSRARVGEVDQHGAKLTLESGALRARVAAKPEGAWALTVGPFALRATGTAFDVHWDPAAQQFSLAVEQGSVFVSGSLVGGERPIGAGERLLASVIEGRLELLSKKVADAPAAVAAGGTAVEAAAAEAAPKAPAGPAWRDLAKSGDLKAAFAAAETHGFQRACDSASPAELLMLGDAARLSGRADRATSALVALRQRYPGDARRAAAAFALGKVAFDQTHNYGQAAKWFATCLQEAPGGPLARESAGRRVEALRNAGDAAGARRAAEDYLARYPEGPHAEVARALLKQ